VIAAVVALRERFPRFGPKKTKARLTLDRPDIVWPAASTIGDILKREGLVTQRDDRRGALDRGGIVAGSDEPNGEWAIDFKGWFRTADGERMHRTLKAETAKTPARYREEQQYRFNVFRRLYNEERPHEALGQVTPASRWQPARRGMPMKMEEPWYDPDHEVRRVRTDGTIKWRGEHVFVGEALARETVGLAEQENGGYIVRFCSCDLGLIDRAGRLHRFAPPRARLRSASKPAKKDV
jgi:hypothetical protein